MKIINKEYHLVDLVNDNNFYKFKRHFKFKVYRCPCPVCLQEGYNKNSLSIKNDYSIGRCFRCETIFVNEYDPLENEFSRSKTPLKLNYELYKLDNLNDYNNINGISKLGNDYLLNRNRLMKIDKYKLRSNDRFVIIPYYINNELVYWQKRFINATINKHFKPVIEYQPFYHINNGSNQLIICEGAFDSFACDNLFNEQQDVIALAGKSMTHYQLWLLNTIKLYDEITIFLDETYLSENLYNNLKNQFTIEPKFNIIKSNGDDPEETLNKNIKLEYL
jgi:hypothetical protein